MIDKADVNIYCGGSWHLIIGKYNIFDNSQQYESFLFLLVNSFGMPSSTLVASLYFLHLYSENRYNVNDTKMESNLPIYLVITSLILSQRQGSKAYPINIWNEVCNEIANTTGVQLSLDIKLLNMLEDHFLACIDNTLYLENCEHDELFWTKLKEALTEEWLSRLHSLANSNNEVSRVSISPSQEPNYVFLKCNGKSSDQYYDSEQPVGFGDCSPTENFSRLFETANPLAKLYELNKLEKLKSKTYHFLDPVTTVELGRSR